MIILIRGANISQAFAWLILLPGRDSLIAILSISPWSRVDSSTGQPSIILGFLSGFTVRYLQADACIDRTRFSNNSTASWLLGRSTGTELDWFGEMYGFLVFRGAEGLPKVIPRWISLKSLFTAARWTRSRRTLLTVVYVTVSRFTTFLIYKWDGYAHLLKKPGFPPIPRDRYFKCPTFWIYDRHLIVRGEGRPPNAQFWPDIYIGSQCISFTWILLSLSSPHPWMGIIYSCKHNHCPALRELYAYTSSDTPCPRLHEIWQHDLWYHCSRTRAVPCGNADGLAMFICGVVKSSMMNSGLISVETWILLSSWRRRLFNCRTPSNDRIN